jgi:nitrite reductase/ring-hydroxylating ferredoxin subunit
MGWTKVLAVEELAPGTRQVVTVGKQKILLLNQSGEFYAVDNRCPHLKLSLNKGKITEDCTIVCPWHRSAFDLKTGKVANWTPWPPVMGKAMAMVSAPKPLPTFATRVEAGSLWVEVAQE